MVQKMLRGRGRLAQVAEMMEKLHISRPLLVCGDHLAAVLAQAAPAVAFVHFGGYHPNPDFADAAAGADMFRAHGCDGLISLGGGSAMDSAKGIKAMLVASSTEDALSSRLPEGAALPHIAIPGTAGTGAEATQFAVMYVDGQKVSLSHPALLPDGVILDANLLDTLPEYHKKSCAMDALSQGIESFWAKAATEESQVQAYLAILGVLDNVRAYLAGDPRAAEAMLDAAYRSGRAIQISRTTAAHAMSYQITKRLGLAHGHACMLTLPALWDRMIDDADCLPVLMDLAQKMRLGSEYMGSRLLAGMVIDLGLEPESMPDEATLDALADSVNLERLSNHPMCLSREDIKGIYRRAFTRRAGADRQVCIDLWKYYGK